MICSLISCEASTDEGRISTDLDICLPPDSRSAEIDAGLHLGVEDGIVEPGEIACGSKSNVIKMGD
jgi:hypothetical protein